MLNKFNILMYKISLKNAPEIKEHQEINQKVTISMTSYMYSTHYY